MKKLFGEPKRFLALWILAIVGLLSLLVLTIARAEYAHGFICGALAFALSIVGIERVTSRVMMLGQVAQGVRSGVFWVIFKFVAPAGLIFFGLSRGFSPLAIVCGILTALGLFSFLLWRLRK